VPYPKPTRAVALGVARRKVMPKFDEGLKSARRRPLGAPRKLGAADELSFVSVSYGSKSVILRSQRRRLRLSLRLLNGEARVSHDNGPRRGRRSSDRAGGVPRRPEEHCMDRGDAIGAVAPQLCTSGRCVMGPDLHREGAAGEGEPAGDSLIGL
jgi:hypothetical protein